MPGAMPSSTGMLTPVSSYDSASEGWQTFDADVDAFEIRSSGPWSREEFARQVLGIEMNGGGGAALAFIATHFPHITSENAKLWLAYMKSVHMAGVNFDPYIMDTFRQLDWYAVLSSGAAQGLVPELAPLFLQLRSRVEAATSARSDERCNVNKDSTAVDNVEDGGGVSTPRGLFHPSRSGGNTGDCEGQCTNTERAKARVKCEAVANPPPPPPPPPPCPCHCHGACGECRPSSSIGRVWYIAEHCEGQCTETERAKAREQCEAAANPPPPPPPQYCVGECTDANIANARAQSAAGLDPSPIPGPDTATAVRGDVAQAKAQCAASDAPSPGGNGSLPDTNEPGKTGAASVLAAQGWVIALSVVVLFL
ncbi:hypothetical protein AURDEDRAFT_175713 [Auricularia subglabra TFB-10046 SS5]|nr:hypothetical protein AURDEDRAFT_175713 [Auricularia subglabra TFB-10046 SS5]